MKKILLVALILVVIAMVGFYLALMRTPTKEQVPVDTIPVATDTDNQDSTDTVTTATMSDEKSGILFTYPTDLDAQYQYISTSEWPPRFISSYAPIDCELDEQTQAMSGLTDRTDTINGTAYCIWERNEGAAGSVYTNYQVSYKQADQYVTMSFTLRYPQCGNYPEAQVQACQSEQTNFPLNRLIDEIAKSTELPS